MPEGVLTYIGECHCPREYILAATIRPRSCVDCGEVPRFKRPDPDCWRPGESK